jgi:uncharacterized alpha-E superfamily protein
MLARVANNLFWMGRYIERSEHLARYLNVNYFSSLDAPNEQSQSRQFVLQSMLFMSGHPVKDEKIELKEEDVLFDIGLNPKMANSIICNVKYIRENANGARDLISTELYEAINKFYHFVLKYPAETFVKSGLYDFTVNVTEMTAILRAKIRGTLLHDKIYAVIMMGVYLERANQVIRIINSKYNDALKTKHSYEHGIRNSFEWITLLKCVESYDMMRRFYKKTPDSLCSLEFLVLNPDCPRSIIYSLNTICSLIEVIDKKEHPDKHSTSFLVGKIRAEYQYKHIEEIEEDMQGFIENMLSAVVQIGQKMEMEFFNY